MNHTITKLPKSKISIVVNLGADELKKHADKAIANFAEHAGVKGFRAGKAPKHLVAEHIGQNRINDETVNVAVENSYTEAVVKAEINPISNPKIEILKFVPGQELEYRAEVLVLPEIKLADYKAIAKKSGKDDRKEIIVEEKEMEDAINWLINSRAKYNKAERESQKGDLVSVSYELKSGDVQIDGGRQKNEPIIIGEGKTMPGFEDFIIGMKAGEKKEFSLDIPADFYNKQIAGKKIDFNLMMEDVMERKLPELNDDFAKSLGGFDSVEALKKNVSDGILREKEAAEKDRFRISLISKIAKDSKMDLSDEIVESELDKMMHELKHDVEHRGMDFDKYLEHIKKTKEDLKKDLQEKAVERVEISLVLKKIGETEGVEASDEEIAEKSNEITSKMGEESKGVDPERIRDYTENILINEKVFEALEGMASGK